MTEVHDGSLAVVEDADDYNKIFETLIDRSGNEHVLIGYVAYVTYKVAKREWVRGFCTCNGRNPNPNELKQYISTRTDSRFTGLRNESAQILAAFADFIIEEERPSIEKKALQHQSFFRDAGVACVGALFYTLLLISFALLLKVADIDALGIFERLGVGHETTPSGAASSPSKSAKPEHLAPLPSPQGIAPR